tara:strand:+ start:692 stop:1423 length:732 start_codon:yes stop_codon:yes gene_type:complete
MAITLRANTEYKLASTNNSVMRVISSEDNLNGLISRGKTEITGALHVTDNAYFKGHIYGDDGTYIYDIARIYTDYVLGDGDTNTYMHFPGSDKINWYTGGAHEMQLNAAGDLHVDGDIVAFSTTTSDIRLKKNIRPLSSSLETICKLDGVKFDWKYRDEKDQIGLIAQEVEKQIPEAIKEGKLPFYASSSIEIDDEGMPNNITSEEIYKTINYDMIVPHLIESIKELKSEVDGLKLKLENKNG